MDESVLVSWQKVPANFKENIKETAKNVVKAIEKLFKGLSVGNVNDEVNTYVETYFRLEEILGVSKESLIHCLNDELNSAGLRGNFTFCEGLVLDEGCNVCLSGKYLEGLFKGYFSLIDKIKGIIDRDTENIGEISKDLGEISKNLKDYDGEYSKILEFSNLPFMESIIWDGKESCGAHLKNLLSPFKTLIAISKRPPQGDKAFELIKDEFIPSCEENKRMIDDFCKNLNDKNLFISDF